MNDIDLWIERWNLIPDGDEIRSLWGVLRPVRYLGVPAMLKVAHEIEERQGAELMAWWDGAGAARVFEIDGDALKTQADFALLRSDWGMTDTGWGNDLVKDEVRITFDIVANKA